MLHHVQLMMQDAAYYYRCCRFHSLRVCVGHVSKLRKNSSTDQDATWGKNLHGPKEPHLRWDAH